MHSLWSLSSKCSHKMHKMDSKIPCYNACGTKRNKNILLTLDSSSWRSHVITIWLPIHLSLASAQPTFFPLGFPGQCDKSMHQQFNKWKKKKKKKTTLHILTLSTMQGVGWLLWWFALWQNRDLSERNVTIRSEIWTMNICSLGF